MPARPQPSAPLLNFDRSSAEAGFELPRGFWRIKLEAPAGVWTAGKIAWGRKLHESAIAVDSQLTLASLRPTPARFHTDHGEDFRLAFHQFGTLEGLSALIATGVQTVARTPRGALNLAGASLPAGCTLVPGWSRAPFAAFDQTSRSTHAHIVDDQGVARAIDSAGSATPLADIPGDDAVLFGSIADALFPGALERVLEALQSSPVVTWDQAPSSGQKRDLVLQPAAPPTLPAALNLVGDGWAVRADAYRSALAKSGADRLTAKRRLLADRLHIHETLSRTGRSASSTYPTQPPPSPSATGTLDVTVIIPTRDQPAHLRACLESLNATQPAHREIVIVDHLTQDPEALGLINMARKNGAKVVKADGAFNFSRLINLGAAQATSRYFCFLNNDVAANAPDWLKALVDEAQTESVGVVGAELRFPDGRLQHAGLVNSTPVGPRHVGLYTDAADRGPEDMLDHTREVLGVTGACFITPRDLYERLNGFDETYPSDYNDLDYCLRCREAGYRILVTPHAVLTHAEGASRGRLTPHDEQLYERMLARHPVLKQIDPYFSPRCEQSPPGWRLRKLRP